MSYSEDFSKPKDGSRSQKLTKIKVAFYTVLWSALTVEALLFIFSVICWADFMTMPLSDWHYALRALLIVWIAVVFLLVLGTFYPSASKDKKDAYTDN